MNITVVHPVNINNDGIREIILCFNFIDNVS
jgi:hypothetical protein